MPLPGWLSRLIARKSASAEQSVDRILQTRSTRAGSFPPIPGRLDRPGEGSFEYLIPYYRNTQPPDIERDLRDLPIEALSIARAAGDSPRQRFLYELTETLCVTLAQYRYWQSRKSLPP